jgi:uncharacterized protein
MSIDGPAGPLELAIDQPPQPRPEGGVAVVAHPHPLFGGTLNNKVVQTLARAYLQAGWTTVRFNFRGVGHSAGVFDHGQGETQDLLAVVASRAPAGPLAWPGSRSVLLSPPTRSATSPATRSLHSLLLVGTAASRFEVPAVPPELHERTLVIHGEADDTVPLAAVFDWARPQACRSRWFPGASISSTAACRCSNRWPCATSDRVDSSLFWLEFLVLMDGFRSMTRLKARSLFLGLVWVVGSGLAMAQQVQPPEVAARAYLLLDLTTQQVLAAKEPDAPWSRLR